MKRPRARAALACLVLLSACTHHRPVTVPSASPTPPLAGTLAVLAATQLKPAFEQIRAQFAAGNPGVTVTATYQGSQALATALQAGRQGDVLASTDDASMASLVSAGALATSTVQPFARDRLEILVPVGNPGGIQTLADLARPGVNLVLADPSLPAGRDARQALALAGLNVTPKSSLPTVALLLTAVLSGKAGAGIAFHSDVVAGGSGVTGVAIPADRNVVETYRIGVLRSSASQLTAGAFVQFVLSAQGQADLALAGFQPPG
jgi:molybdate transport system substrate-binding protein